MMMEIYLLQIDPAKAFVLASSPKETVADLASRLIVADSLLRLFLFCPEGLADMSACTSNLYKENKYS